MGLLGNIFLAPIKIPCFVAKKVHEIAMEELLDEGKVREELKQLYVQVESGRISEEEFEQREEELVDLLEGITAYKESKQG